MISLIVSVAILWLDKPPLRTDFPLRTEFVDAPDASTTHTGLSLSLSPPMLGHECPAAVSP